MPAALTHIKLFLMEQSDVDPQCATEASKMQQQMTKQMDLADSGSVNVFKGDEILTLTLHPICYI